MEIRGSYSGECRVFDATDAVAAYLDSLPVAKVAPTLGVPTSVLFADAALRQYVIDHEALDALRAKELV